MNNTHRQVFLKMCAEPWTDIFDEPRWNKIRSTFKATDSSKALLYLKATTSNKLQKIFETVYFIQGGKLI